MAAIFSIYKAKARFSKVIRQVREAKTITVSYRGKPVTEIGSVRRRRKSTMDEQLEDLERSGSLVRSTVPRRILGLVERRPGSLSRFLAERNE